MNNPKVSVLMPVYNGEAYLNDAIESILTQTYKDFEFLIINDGSTDASDKIIRSYNDQRIVYIYHKTNRGVSHSLNTGLARAKGKYVSRMDCDDISMPDRVEQQVRFLEKNPDYGLVGCLFGLIDRNSILYDIGGIKLFGNEELKLALLFGNVFCHGEVTFRKNILTKHRLSYSPKYICEDYDLWIEMSKFTNFKIIPSMLYKYRVHDKSISNKSAIKMQADADAISNMHQERTGFPIITPKKIWGLLTSSRLYRDGDLSIENKNIKLYLLLAYQVFLFRLGKTYIRKKRLDGIFLLLSSFLINPLNWKRHALRQFPVNETNPTLA
jgi:glycosyltransferase involved in cell wall biosynthesis